MTNDEPSFSDPRALLSPIAVDGYAMPEVSRRVGAFTDSVIRRMTRIANAHGAVNLSQGFPDFDPPTVLKRALAQAAAGSSHQYAVTWGAPEFRAALARKQSRFMGLPVNPETEIVVTCGSTEAMMAAMLTVCDPGDKVIVFSPFYENYAADAILSGAEPIFVPLCPPSFVLDLDRLEDAFRQRPKALILCNPANPSGKVFTRAELEAIAGLARRYDAFVITDEVYEHIVYAPFVHTYFATLPGMFERTLACGSLSKTYSITGWRLGYLIAPAALIDGARKVHDFLTVGAAAPLQEAALAALELPDSYYRQLLHDYTHRRNLFLSGLADLGMRFTRPEGAYYVLVDLEQYGVEDDLAFCEWLAQTLGVAAVPGSSFFREAVPPMMRLHFAKRDETLCEALNRLEALPRRLAGRAGASP